MISIKHYCSVIAILLVAVPGMNPAFAKPEAGKSNLYLSPSGQDLRALRVDPQAERYLQSGSVKKQEMGKIFYLLSQIENSPYVFIRNGYEHEGKSAAKHLRWKYQSAMRRIQTANQFIEHIVARSLSSGQAYLLKVSDHHAYPLRQVLHNELTRLEKSKAP